MTESLYCLKGKKKDLKNSTVDEEGNQRRTAVNEEMIELMRILV